jgi:uncharacterized protein YndB with AHSA1/START domain
MNKDLSVTGTTLINASREQVWDALTNPSKIKEYLSGTETVTDWKAGSPIVFQGEYNGQQYKDHGTILANIPCEVIKYTYWSAFTGLEDIPDNYSTITYLVDVKGQNLTQLQWIQKGYASEAGYQHSLQGMDAFMKQIKEIAER